MRNAYRTDSFFMYQKITKKTATDGMAAFLSFIIYLETGIKQFR